MRCLDFSGIRLPFLPNHFYPNCASSEEWPLQRAHNLRRFSLAVPLAESLLGKRSSFRWAARHHVSFHGRFLVGYKIDLCFEGLISRQTDFYGVFARGDQQRLPDPREFGDVANEDAIDEYSGAIGFHVQLNFRGDLGQLNPGVFLHLYVKALFLSGAHRNFLHEIQISALTHGNFVITWEQEKFFRSFQLAQIADVLAIDPDARSVLDF